MFGSRKTYPCTDVFVCSVDIRHQFSDDFFSTIIFFFKIKVRNEHGIKNRSLCKHFAEAFVVFIRSKTFLIILPVHTTKTQKLPISFVRYPRSGGEREQKIPTDEEPWR